MTTTILQTVDAPGVSIELYADGDVIVTTKTRYGNSFASLPYAIMKALYAQLGPDAGTGPTEPKPAKVSAKIEKTPEGWKARVKVGKTDQEYFYRTRDQARGVKPIHAVGGTEGRVK